MRLIYRFEYEGGVSAGGELTISIDDCVIGRGRIAPTISKLPELADTFDDDFDANTLVTDEYQSDDHLVGAMRRLKIALDRYRSIQVCGVPTRILMLHKASPSSDRTTAIR